MDRTPFEQGQEAFRRNGFPPAYPKPDMSWADRLRYCGWDCEARKAAAEQKGGRRD